MFKRKGRSAEDQSSSDESSSNNPWTDIEGVEDNSSQHSSSGKKSSGFIFNGSLKSRSTDSSSDKSEGEGISTGKLTTSTGFRKSSLHKEHSGNYSVKEFLNSSEKQNGVDPCYIESLLGLPGVSSGHAVCEKSADEVLDSRKNSISEDSQSARDTSNSSEISQEDEPHFSSIDRNSPRLSINNSNFNGQLPGSLINAPLNGDNLVTIRNSSRRSSSGIAREIASSNSSFFENASNSFSGSKGLCSRSLCRPTIFTSTEIDGILVREQGPLPESIQRTHESLHDRIHARRFNSSRSLHSDCTYKSNSSTLNNHGRMEGSSLGSERSRSRNPCVSFIEDKIIEESSSEEVGTIGVDFEMPNDLSIENRADTDVRDNIPSSKGDDRFSSEWEDYHYKSSEQNSNMSIIVFESTPAEKSRQTEEHLETVFPDGSPKHLLRPCSWSPSILSWSTPSGSWYGDEPFPEHFPTLSSPSSEELDSPIVTDRFDETNVQQRQLETSNREYSEPLEVCQQSPEQQAQDSFFQTSPRQYTDASHSQSDAEVPESTISKKRPNPMYQKMSAFLEKSPKNIDKENYNMVAHSFGRQSLTGHSDSPSTFSPAISQEQVRDSEPKRRCKRRFSREQKLPEMYSNNVSTDESFYSDNQEVNPHLSKMPVLLKQLYKAFDSSQTTSKQSDDQHVMQKRRSTTLLKKTFRQANTTSRHTSSFKKSRIPNSSKLKTVSQSRYNLLKPQISNKKSVQISSQYSSCLNVCSPSTFTSTKESSRINQQNHFECENLSSCSETSTIPLKQNFQNIPTETSAKESTSKELQITVSRGKKRFSYKQFRSCYKRKAALCVPSSSDSSTRDSTDETYHDRLSITKSGLNKRLPRKKTGQSSKPVLNLTSDSDSST